MTAILYSSVIGPVPVDVIVREQHKIELGITAIPIETGAEVNDHAYVKQKRLTLDIADGAAAETFNALVAFQESRVPFTVVSGLFVYSNMLIASGSFTRDKDFSSVLNGQVELQEIIIVDTAYATGETGDEGEAANTTKGDNKGRAKRPTSSAAGDAATADRTAGTVQRGDSPVSTAPTTGASPEAVQNRSILKAVFG